MCVCVCVEEGRECCFDDVSEYIDDILNDLSKCVETKFRCFVSKKCVISRALTVYKKSTTS